MTTVGEIKTKINRLVRYGHRQRTGFESCPTNIIQIGSRREEKGHVEYWAREVHKEMNTRNVEKED